jgi:hypothetical protein
MRGAGRLTIAVAVIALALVSVAVAASTPAVYRKQASTVCSATNSLLNAVPKPTKTSQIESFLNKDLVIFHAQLKKLRTLTPPNGLRALHLKALAWETLELAAIQQLVDKIHGGTPPETAFNSLSKKLTTLAKSESAVWKKLKIKSCAAQ